MWAQEIFLSQASELFLANQFLASSPCNILEDFGFQSRDLLEKVPQDLFHSVYFEYEENSTHDRLLSLNYAFCHIKRLIKTSEPVYTD